MLPVQIIRVWQYLIFILSWTPWWLQRQQRMGTESTLLWQPGTALKLPLISFLGIQCWRLHKMWLSCLSHTQSQGFSCSRLSHSAWFIHSWIAALDLWLHHVNATPCNLPHLARVCTGALLESISAAVVSEKWALKRFRLIRKDSTICLDICCFDVVWDEDWLYIFSAGINNCVFDCCSGRNKECWSWHFVEFLSVTNRSVLTLTGRESGADGERRA